MPQQILTRYGSLPPLLAVAMRKGSETAAQESIALLDAAYRSLSISTAHEIPSAELPSTRWADLMGELFRTEQNALLADEARTWHVGDAALIAALADDTDYGNVAKGIFAAVAMFLVAEANRLRSLLPADDEESADDEFSDSDELDTAVLHALRHARVLRQSVNEGTWPELCAPSPQDELDGPATSSENLVAHPEFDRRPWSETVGGAASRRLRLHRSRTAHSAHHVHPEASKVADTVIYTAEPAENSAAILSQPVQIGRARARLDIQVVADDHVSVTAAPAQGAALRPVDLAIGGFVAMLTVTMLSLSGVPVAIVVVAACVVAIFAIVLSQWHRTGFLTPAMHPFRSVTSLISHRGP